MSEPEHIREADERQPAPSYTPASFEKRAAAWMGLAYMLFILFAITYAMFTGGKALNGTFPLLVLPAAAAAAVVAVYRQRRGTALGGLPLTIVIVVLCVAGSVFCLLAGVPALIAALRSPMG